MVAKTVGRGTENYDKTCGCGEKGNNAWMGINDHASETAVQKLATKYTEFETLPIQNRDGIA